MSDRAALDELAAVYREVQAEAVARATGQAPREIFERVIQADVACVAESLGPRTQMLTGIPWVLPTLRLSDKGDLLDRDLLRHFGYTADPLNEQRTYAYLTDVSHLWLGRTPGGKLRRPTARDKAHCAPWLERELEAIRPRVVILLGRHAVRFFLLRYGGFSVRSLDEVTARPCPVRVGRLETIAVPTFHPTGAQMAPGGSIRAYASTAGVVAGLLGEGEK